VPRPGAHRVHVICTECDPSPSEGGCGAGGYWVVRCAISAQNTGVLRRTMGHKTVILNHISNFGVLASQRFLPQSCIQRDWLWGSFASAFLREYILKKGSKSCLSSYAMWLRPMLEGPGVEDLTLGSSARWSESATSTLRFVPP